MRVLVTGAAGDIGSRVVAGLSAGGHTVDALVLPGLPVPPGVDRVYEGNCADPELVAKACRGVDALAHLAAIPSPSRPPDEVFGSNTRATHAVLEAAGAAGVRRVAIASSVSVLGLAFGRPVLRPAYLPIDEEHPILAEDPYALSKQVDECTAAMMHRRWGMDVVALRMPFVGSGDRLAERLRRGREDPGSLVGDLWGYLCTEDAALAFKTVLEHPPLGCTVVMIAATDTVCELTTAQLLARYLPEVPVRQPLPGHRSVLRLDRARTVLGWVPGPGWRDR